MTASSESLLRIIKKYPNRRLYDTEISAYVTLGEIRNLVLDHTSFRVVDNRTGKDVTRVVLFQIIAEQEEHGAAPLFSVEMLSGMIRFYGDALQGTLGTYLNKSLELFTEQQEMLRKSTMDPLAVMTEITRRNFTLWQSWINREKEP